MPEFAAYKSNYKVGLIDENLALINIVEAIPNHIARNEPVKGLRKEAIAEKDDASDFFKLLRGYCTTAFKDDVALRDAMYGEAGQTYFEKLNNNTWEIVDGLLTAMVSFVRKRETVLMESGYMPASFLKRLEDKQTSFTTAYQLWQTEKKATPATGEAKIIANNDLKTRAMVVIGDAPLALIKRKDIAQKFVWSTILAHERGNRPTGLCGKITDAATKGPLSIATATIDSLGLTVTCDKEGRYDFGELAEGEYTIVFKCTGYKNLSIEAREVKGGVKGRLNAALEAIVQVATER